jgi:hypothetical protein
LVAEIKGKMGFPVVGLEIDPQHEEIILNSTFRWFNARKGIVVERPLSIRNGQGEYALEKEVLGVIDYYPEITGNINYPTIAEDVLDIDYVSPSYTTSYADLVQHLQMMERRREVFSVKSSWDFVSNFGTPKKPFVRIYPYPTNNKTAMLVLRIKMNREMLKFASPIDEEFVVRYGETVLKEILIHVRGKFSEIPAAQNAVSFDADRLTEEVNSERERLEVEIRDFQEPMGIYMDRQF